MQKAYEQVAEQMRELVISGRLPAGQRLPSEAALAREFGVSRPTIREALRVLSAQNLVRTVKGAAGGSYVTLPTLDHISEFLTSNLRLLSETQNVALEEFLEARRLLEVEAARLAAARSDDQVVERLRATIPGASPALDPREHFRFNREFHFAVLQAARNTLLYIAGQPIFFTLQRSLPSAGLGDDHQSTVHQHHEAIAEAIAAHDPDAAAQRMEGHMDFLAEAYSRVWRRR